MKQQYNSFSEMQSQFPFIWFNNKKLDTSTSSKMTQKYENKILLQPEHRVQYAL